MSPEAARLRDLDPFRPRVIRRGQKPDRSGRFKWAIDYRLGARIERVKARDARPCDDGECLMTIMPRTEYVKVHANEGRGKFIKGLMIYSPCDYHPGCVPEQYRPLLRFLSIS